ncbi:hypothetical protein M011DRAFT_527274 [Sporormia fimetaria CBS 119925]|uniref:Uncharacterized protein n=1 Tax=Sporormia fimetaria CBS 119925 TaxID=1340428 RepID=A0A6A6VAG3_9PLEO|nr:hypothetical protein M011DRAFT_527274 [Sporormia fimetaria CBS 119925]
MKTNTSLLLAITGLASAAPLTTSSTSNPLTRRAFCPDRPIDCGLTNYQIANQKWVMEGLFFLNQASGGSNRKSANAQIVEPGKQGVMIWCKEATAFYLSANSDAPSNTYLATGAEGLWGKLDGAYKECYGGSPMNDRDAVIRAFQYWGDGFNLLVAGGADCRLRSNTAFTAIVDDYSANYQTGIAGVPPAPGSKEKYEPWEGKVDARTFPQHRGFRHPPSKHLQSTFKAPSLSTMSKERQTSSQDTPSQGDVPQETIRSYELNKYLQLVRATAPAYQTHHINAVPLPSDLPELQSLRDSLDSEVRFLCLHLKARGAAVVLTSGPVPYFLAAADSLATEHDQLENRLQGGWLGSEKEDLELWGQLLESMTAMDGPETEEYEECCVKSDIKREGCSASISTVSGPPHLGFFAGSPMISAQNIAVGVVFVVDSALDRDLSAAGRQQLKRTAQCCVNHLQTAGKSAEQYRWERMSRNLGRFLQSRAVKEKQLEEPLTPAKEDQRQRRQSQVNTLRKLATDHHQDPSVIENLVSTDEGLEAAPPSAESQDKAEGSRPDTNAVTSKSLENQEQKIADEVKGDKKRHHKEGEATYRKIFTRAAEFLRDALQIDGVLFTDGLVGFHGTVQTTAETVQELQHSSFGKPTELEGNQSQSGPTKRSETDASTRRSSVLASRIYSSPEYIRGVHSKFPAEILGMSVDDKGLFPICVEVMKGTSGLAHMHARNVEQLMASDPSGNLWYIHGAQNTCYSTKSGTLVEDLSQDTQCLISNFPGVRQIYLLHLCCPTGSRRLASCIAWTRRLAPVFTADTGLFATGGFLHVLESEVARVDAAAALKQKEALVSSVSHELRTPLHGILGSVQLLGDTQLDGFQSTLVETIKTSGSTLNETLTSVLTYAKINQYERHQQRQRAGQAAESRWSLQSAIHGPDVDYNSLFMPTNVAEVCEEVAEVLNIGRIYQRRTNNATLPLTLEIDYHDNWVYCTEPGALRRIAINIIGNALKYTTTGSIDIKVSVSELGGREGSTPDETRKRFLVTLIVKDTGQGMSQHFMQHSLFVPFTQENATGSLGVGLGMSIVKSLVSLLAGEIKVESQVGKGTCITVKLPMTLSDSAAQQAEETTSSSHANIERIRDEHILVAVFGFPDTLRHAFDKYLVEWFHCRVATAVETEEPHVIMFDELDSGAQVVLGNLPTYHHQNSVLLSVAITVEKLAQPSHVLEEYAKRHRIARPVGPSKLRRALLECVDMMKRQDIGFTVTREIKDSVEQQPAAALVGSKSPAPVPTPCWPISEQNTPMSETIPSADTLKPGSPDYFHKPKNYAIPKHAEFLKSHDESNSSKSLESSSLRILVVEDNAVNRKILRAYLEKYGCHAIQQAEHGAIAVSAVKRQCMSFDVIFMDINMPVMDGLCATREIRRFEEIIRSAMAPEPFVASFIVALTGLASESDELAAHNAGVDMYVTKPFKFERLKAILKEREEALSKAA